MYHNVFICGIRFTYLDSKMNGGRPVLTLKASKVVPDHDEQIVITYSFDKPRMVVEPLMLIGSFLAFFLVCSLLVRIDTAKINAATEKSDFIK